MLEFTGERVIPGLADPDLFNEHRARYRFARRFAAGAMVLDAGCGTGYGAAEFTDARSVTGFDISSEAVRHARASYPSVRLLRAACESFPFADESFDLVVAFEVIEHLARWPELLAEARRVLKPSGVFLVSTPNKAYYAESRAQAGPNPFHVHEFEFGEFSSALAQVFPHVRMWTQNHAEAITFLAPASATGELDAPEERNPGNAHFFIGACSRAQLGSPTGFAYLPASGNLLRERERHIALLEAELSQKTEWLQQLETAHAALHREHENVIVELGEHNVWAEKLNEQLHESGAQIRGLQAEFEREAVSRLAWVHDLESQIRTGAVEIERLNAENTGLRVFFEERTKWGESLAAELTVLRQETEAALFEIAHLKTVIAAVGDSKWVRLGRAIHLGPDVRGQNG